MNFFLKFIEEKANKGNHHISLIYAFYIRNGLYEGKNIGKTKNGIALFQLGLLYKRIFQNP